MHGIPARLFDLWAFVREVAELDGERSAMGGKPDSRWTMMNVKVGCMNLIFARAYILRLIEMHTYFLRGIGTVFLA
jgi:hypothetical protein